MSRQRRDSAIVDRPAKATGGGARDRLRDAGSKDLAILTRKLGNDRVQGLIREATGKRDAMLAFAQERLAKMKQAQEEELKSMARDRVWFDEVARGKKGFKLPDPTRWRGPAVLYRRAVEALCRGDLARGAQLLDKALVAERAAYDAMPDQVKLPASAREPAAGPDEAAMVEDGDSCPATTATPILHVADEIVRVADRSPMQPTPRRLGGDRAWWSEEAEEVEGDGKKEETPKPEGQVEKVQVEEKKEEVEEVGVEKDAGRATRRKKK